MANKYLNYLRPALRQTAETVMPGPRWAKRRIVVSGLPRSGTSWVAKALSLSPNVAYYFEPDSVLEGRHWYVYPDAHAGNPLLARHISAAFAGRIHTEYVIAERGLREILTTWRADVVLIKWVKLVLCLDWLAQHFPDVTVVQTVRHPVPLTLSWRKRGWDPGHALDLLLAQPGLMTGPLAPYADAMRSAESYWERAGAFWGAIAFMQLRQHRPGWVLREHERFCIDPVEQYRALTQQLGLAWSDRIAGFATGENRRTVGPGYGRRRDPRQEIHKWETGVTRGERDQLESVVRVFDLPFYARLDPEVFRDSQSSSRRAG